MPPALQKLFPRQTYLQTAWFEATLEEEDAYENTGVLWPAYSPKPAQLWGFVPGSAQTYVAIESLQPAEKALPTNLSRFFDNFLTIFEVFFLHGWRRHVCRGCTGHLVLVNGELRVLLTIFKAFTLKNIGFFRGFWRCKLV